MGDRVRHPQDTRARILAAAAELSGELGPARVSLEAVAARAGISKGGLLYHFPSKHNLLRALVEEHVEEIRRDMERLAPGARAAGDARAVARAYLAVIRRKLDAAEAPPAGVFAAIAEDPEFIAPLRAFRAELRRAFDACPDPLRATVALMACEGLLHERLTDPQAAHAPPTEALFSELEALVG